MANINVPGSLPEDGAEVPFGPYCVASTTRIGSNGTHDPVGRTLAEDDRVYLDRLDKVTVPYVNAWLTLVGMPKRVDKYWRTKEYRLITPGVQAAKAAARPMKVRRLRPTSQTPASGYLAPLPAPLPAPQQPTLVVRSEPQQPVTVTIEPQARPVTTPVPAPAPKVKATKKRIDGQDYVQVGSITVSAADFATMSDALDAVKAGQTASVVVTGPSGTAKTLMVEAFAAYAGMSFVKADGGNVRTADDWFGTLVQDPNTKVWTWVWNEFGTALLNGTPCVALLDEANRAESASALNAVMGLLDRTGRAFVPAAMTTLRRPQGMLVVATANKGAEYVGTVPFDAAVTQRFGAGVRLTYLPSKVETNVVDGLTGIGEGKAARLVAMAAQQRGLKDDVSQFPSGVGVSTRMLVDIGDRIARDLNRGVDDIRAAVLSNFNAQFEVEDFGALLNIVDTHFPPSANDTLDVDTSAITEEA